MRVAFSGDLHNCQKTDHARKDGREKPMSGPDGTPFCCMLEPVNLLRGEQTKLSNSIIYGDEYFI